MLAESTWGKYTDGRGISMELPQALKVSHCCWCLAVTARPEMIRAIPRLRKLSETGHLRERAGEWNERPYCTDCKDEFEQENGRGRL